MKYYLLCLLFLVGCCAETDILDLSELEPCPAFDGMCSEKLCAKTLNPDCTDSNGRAVRCARGICGYDENGDYIKLGATVCQACTASGAAYYKPCMLPITDI